jgi:hypothetical protein
MRNMMKKQKEYDADNLACARTVVARDEQNYGLRTWAEFVLFRLGTPEEKAKAKIHIDAYEETLKAQRVPKTDSPVAQTNDPAV